MENELPPESQPVADGEPLSPRPRLSRRPSNEDTDTLDQEYDSRPPPEGPPPETPPPDTEPATQPPEPEAWRYRLEFTGTAGEYFRIWIVNLFLTVVTFGIYAAWAKVRTRKYVYSNTWLGEDAFAYHGPAIAILKGNIIVAVGFIAYMFSGYIHPILPMGVLAVFFFIFPLLVWKAIGFKARYSSIRNIRFRFDGSINDAYINYLWYYFLMPFTLGIIYPYIKFVQKRYFINDMHFGDQRFNFRGDAGGFYIPYLILFGIGVGLWFTVVLGAGLVGGLNAVLLEQSGSQSSEYLFIALFAAMYLLFILLQTVLPQLIYSMIQKYTFERAALGEKISFTCHYKAWELMWIRLSNVLAIVFSLGLLVPWTAMRRARYLVENIEVTVQGDILDEIQGRFAEAESALGDSAVDAFDFEIGL